MNIKGSSLTVLLHKKKFHSFFENFINSRDQSKGKQKGYTGWFFVIKFQAFKKSIAGGM